MKNNITQYYINKMRKQGYQADITQLVAINKLSQFYDNLIYYEKNYFKNIFFKRFFKSYMSSSIKGIYLCGDVGRGKSFLMNCFFEKIPIKLKTRIHFYKFMKIIHMQLHKLQGHTNSISLLAKFITYKQHLICLDEFHITNIADAILLHQLFHKLLENGVNFIITSNYYPDMLYPNSLYREHLLPIIEIIKKNMSIVNIGIGIDYRKKLIVAKIPVYYTPLGHNTDYDLSCAFKKLVTLNTIEYSSTKIKINQRQLSLIRCTNNGIIWLNFSTLCENICSYSDYVELANRFHTIILSNVPQMNNCISSTQRFIWLIDVLYEYQVKLLISAAVPLDKLCTNNSTMKYEFSRTISRITAMQSDQYLNSAGNLRKKIVDQFLS